MRLPPRLPALVLLLRVLATEGFIRAVCWPNSTALDFEALPALFGPGLPPEGLAGILVEARLAYACRPFKSLPNASSSSSSSVFIALIHRHNCSFVTKVWHAQQAGFRAAIVHNVHSQTLVSMGSEVGAHLHVSIPAMFTAEATSSTLRRLCRAGRLTSVVLVPSYFHAAWRGSPPRVSPPYSCCCRHLQLPGSCSSQVFLVYTCWILCVLGFDLIASLLIERYLLQAQRLKLRRRQLLPENGPRWASIPINPSTYQECAICLESYARRDSLKVLSCSHAFHGRCIDLWHITQAGSKTCPLCMQKVRVVTLLHAARPPRERPREGGWRTPQGKCWPVATGHGPPPRPSEDQPYRF